MENKNKNNEKKIIRNETQSVTYKPTSYEQKYIKSKMGTSSTNNIGMKIPMV